ncbi:hypothetical protein HHX47_DHR5000600 [Lentinula edodes]|nr:hypothetical protein HHX47_DHR5000600 [Lentinula edodes]
MTPVSDLYYLNFPKDSWRLKTLVYGLFIWDILQTALYTSTVFASLASGWGDVAALEGLGLIWFDIPFMSGVASIAIVDAVMYIVFQHNNYHAAPVAILAKLYTNALMVLFNSRRRHESTHSTVNYTWDGEGGPPSNRPGISSDSVFNRAISVDVNVNRTTDAPVESYSMAPFSSQKHADEGFGSQEGESKAAWNLDK